MLSTLERARRTPISRSGDRLVALAGIGVALTFLVSALASLALPGDLRRGLWLPLHLALAGGATTAIAALVPFFVAAFAAAQPADVRLRAFSVGTVALGALLVTAGVIGEVPVLAVCGGLGFVGGIGLVALATVRPLAGSLGPSRGIVTRGYLMAFVSVGIGAMIATLFIAGWAPVTTAWDRLRPAHAWLNLVGFVSLVIATTLVHFWPTVVGARIGAHRSGKVTVIALAGGPPVVAAGYWLDLSAMVRVGAAVSLIGAVSLVLYGRRIWNTRARWTSDASWHRFVMGGIASAIGWFAVGMVLLGGRAIAFGTAAESWSVVDVVGPLVVGWVSLAIVAAATHLVPAVGPGDPIAHARQRLALGRAGEVRLLAIDAGVAGISVGLPLGRSDVALASGAILAAALAATVVTLVRAIMIGLSARSPTSTGPTRP